MENEFLHFQYTMTAHHLDINLHASVENVEKSFMFFFLYLTFMNCFDSGRFLNWFNRRRKKKNGGNIGVEWFPRQANMNVVLFMETTHYRQKNSNVYGSRMGQTRNPLDASKSIIHRLSDLCVCLEMIIN